jgi:putative flippase GtrA
MPELHTHVNRPFTRFLLVGAMGFIVDGGLLTWLMQAGWSPLPARLVSFLAAVTATWLLNRGWTFQPTRGASLPHREYARYFGVQTVGAGVNLGIFLSLLHRVPAFERIPVIPLIFGSAVALLFNYAASSRLVFRR